eukprot:s3645_g6.t1
MFIDHAGSVAVAHAIVRSAKIFLHKLPDKLTASGQGGGGPLSLQELKDTMVSSKGASRIAIGSVCHTDSAKAYKKLASEEALPALYKGALGGSEARRFSRFLPQGGDSVAPVAEEPPASVKHVVEEPPVPVLDVGDQGEQDDDEVLRDLSADEMPEKS